jgi:predicted lipoprotein with Yx(FWY)xxD motif
MKRFSFFSALVALVFLLALTACGGSAAPSGSTTGNSVTPTASPSTAGTTLGTTSTTISGKTVMLLTDNKGMTLYYFKPDTTTTAACTTGCISTWPPLLSLTSNGPTSATSLPGHLTIQTNANGQQIEYNGHPLYSYSGDTSPGQTNGEGIGNKWFVATTDLAMNTASTNATPTSQPYKRGY